MRIPQVNEHGEIDPQAFAQWSYEELQEWVYLRLRGRDIFVPGHPSELDMPHYLLALLYPKLPRQVREDLQEIVLGFLRDLLRNPNSEWRGKPGDELLLLVDPVLIQSPQRDEAVDILLDIANSDQFVSQQGVNLHFRALQSLTMLRYRGDRNFWSGQFLKGGCQYAPAILEGLSLVDVSALFDWLAGIKWNEAIEGAFINVLPKLLEDYGVAKVTTFIQELLSKIGEQEAQALLEFCKQEELTVVSPTGKAAIISYAAGAQLVSTLPLWHALFNSLCEREDVGKKAFVGALEEILPAALLTIVRREATEIAEYFRELNFLENSELERTGIKLGESLAMLSSQDEKKVWRSLLDAMESNGKPNLAITAAYALKGYARHRDEEMRRDIGAPNVVEVMNEIRNVRNQIQRLANAWSKSRARLQRIVVARGPFHEDKLLTKLFSLACYGANLRDIDIEVAPWGDLQTNKGAADVVVCNENAIALRPLRLFPIIYEFSGYYVFCRRSWLSGLDQKAIPEAARKAQAELLSPEEVRANTPPRTPRRGRLVRARSNAWLCAYGGLRYKVDTDFEKVRNILFHSANKVQRLEVTTEPISDYDDEFIQFLSGEVKVFMGGAIHAALLRRWFAPYGPIVLMLEPQDLKILIPDAPRGKRPPSWPMRDRLFFAGRLGVERTGKAVSILRAELASTYQVLGSILHIAARGWRQGRTSASFLKYLLGILVTESKERDWVFLTHEQDLANVLLRDDNFLLS